MLASRADRRTIIQMVVVGAIATALGIALGLIIDWFPAQGSTQAKDIDTLWDVLVIASVPFFVLVSVVVLFSVLKFRMRPGQENMDGPPIHGNTKLEVVWTAIPAILLVALCTYAYVVLTDIEDAPANAGQERRITVVGEQFTWTFRYDEGGQKFQTSQLYVPEGESVKFDIVSRDVLHDFWVPAWRMKIDAVPGITTTYRVTPTRTGTFPVVCAELCGLGHAFMRQTAHVLPPERFEQWVAQQAERTAGDGQNGGAAGAGGQSATVDAKRLFLEGNSAGATACGACHKLADAESAGGTGPDLDKALRGQDEASIRDSIVDPDAEVTEGFSEGIMPQNYGDILSDEELDALVKYLAEVTSK